MLTAFSAQAEAVRARHSEAELVAESSTIRPGETIWLALILRLDPGWHTYWLNPGESGMPPRLQWTLPDGFARGSLQAPAPSRFESDGVIGFGYEKRAVFLIPVTAPDFWPTDATASVGLKADWLICSDICLPETARLVLELGGRASEPEPETARLFDDARKALPGEPAGWSFRAERAGGEILLRATPPGGLPEAPREAAFFPLARNLFTYDTASVPQEATRIRLAVSPLAGSFPERVTGVWVAGDLALAVDVPIE